MSLPAVLSALDKPDAVESLIMAKNPIKVLIVDDHPGVREGIRKLLGDASDIVVVGEGTNGADAIHLIHTEDSDILLLDIQLPDTRGDRVLHQIHKTRPDVKVLAVSSFTEREYILGMVENGAAGYITKDEVPGMLVNAIRGIVNDGKNWFSPQVLNQGELSPLEEQMLTNREIAILNQLILDLPPAQIASSLQMEHRQLDKYLAVLMKKFEAESLDGLKYSARRIFLRRKA